MKKNVYKFTIKDIVEAFFIYICGKPRANEEWDKELNELLDSNDIEIDRDFYNIGDVVHVISIGTVSIWVSNYPYNFGHKHGICGYRYPKLLTYIRLKKALIKAGLKKEASNFILL